MNESLDIKVARLEEQTKASNAKLDRVLEEITQLNKMQVIIDRNNRDFPRLQTQCDEIYGRLQRLERTVSNTRAFVMGISAAFGFMGSMLAIALKKFMGQ